MNSVIAVTADGVWMPVQTQAVDQGTDRSNVIEFDTKNDVERIVDHLGQVVRLAQSLSGEDARRARDFVHATSAMLTATTYLAGSDQAQLERALRR